MTDVSETSESEESGGEEDLGGDDGMGGVLAEGLADLVEEDRSGGAPIEEDMLPPVPPPYQTIQ